MSGNAYLESPLAESSSRGQPRRLLHLETTGTLISGERANVTVHNVSSTGFLIETDVGLSINEAVTVDLPQSPPVVARVAWASSHLFGCQFDQQISDSVLSAMQLQGGPPLDAAATIPTGLRQSSSATMGKQLEQLRKKRGMTLADVAGQLGVSKPTVWAWEKGKARPVESRLPDIAKALDISEQELAAMAVPPAVNDLLETSKRKIADAFGTVPEKVRVMIEL